MSEWPMVKLGEVAKVVSGGTPKTSVSEYWDGDIPWVTPKDLSNNKELWISSGSRSITELGLAKSGATLLPSQTVLWSSRAPIGLVAIASNPIATNQGFKSFIPGDKLDSNYLAHFLMRSQAALQNLGVGATFKEVSAQRAAEIRIPLPPLREQKRIAEILLKVGEAIKKTEQQITRTKTLKENEYNSLSNEIQEFKPLKDIGVNKVTGKSIAAKSGQAHNRNRVIKVSAVSSGSFIPSESKPLPMDYIPNESHKINQGDLLFARASGSANLLGACCIVGQQVDNLYLPDKVWKLEVNEEILPKAYLLQTLRSKKFRAIAESLFSSSTGVKNIKSSVLMDFTIPIPTRNQLQDFSNFIAFADSLTISLYSKLTLLQELQRSLSARAFAGEL